MARRRRSALDEHRAVHVVANAVDGAALFTDDRERFAYLDLVDEHLPGSGVRLACFCLMTTHVHLLVAHRDAASLAEAIQGAHARFAEHVNDRRARRGHLFRSRYHATAIRDDAHAWSAARYIERNPLTAGIVRHPAAYRWSSFGCHLGRRHPPAALDPLLIDEIFGSISTYEAAVLDVDDLDGLRRVLAAEGIAEAARRGWTQRQIAAATGHSQSSIQRALARSTRSGSRTCAS